VAGTAEKLPAGTVAGVVVMGAVLLEFWALEAGMAETLPPVGTVAAVVPLMTAVLFAETPVG
jgi:hypothetical protein